VNTFLDKWSIVAACATLCALFYAASRASAKLAEVEALRLARDLGTLSELSAVAKRSGPPLTALVTGANSGIGFMLSLLLAGAGVRVFLGCRNRARGEDAVARIRRKYPCAEVELVLIDVSDPVSLFEVLRSGVLTKFGCLDFVFLNAGVMPIQRMRWGILVESLLRCRSRYFLQTGRALPSGPHFLASPSDSRRPDTCPSVFASNVVGHYILLRDLSPALRVAAAALRRKTGRVVWTGSVAALHPLHGFDWNLIEPANMPVQRRQASADSLAVTRSASARKFDAKEESYGVSKAAVDLLNVRLRWRLITAIYTLHPTTTESPGPHLFVHKCLSSLLQAAFPRRNPAAGIESVVVCPGFVHTEMSPSFVVAFLPLLSRIR
jgi:NAD(P)-dependent dehydrogenase (short-subunit alcohol dehydrogenase family)